MFPCAGLPSTIPLCSSLSKGNQTKSDQSGAVCLSLSVPKELPPVASQLYISSVQHRKRQSKQQIKWPALLSIYLESPGDPAKMGGSEAHDPKERGCGKPWLKGHGDSIYLPSVTLALQRPTGRGHFGQDTRTGMRLRFRQLQSSLTQWPPWFV